MTVKRRSVKKGKLHTLFANVSRKNKRHRAATAAVAPEDLEGDVPNLGIGKALLVILAIHVVAIGGIFYHSSRFGKSETVDASEPKESKRVVSLASSEAIRVTPSISRLSEPVVEEELPMFRASDQIYSAGTGDTYSSIAARYDIDEMELRSANENIPLRQGRRLRIPPKSITAIEPADIAELRVTTPPASAPADDWVTTDAARALDEQIANAPRAVPVQERRSAATEQATRGTQGTYQVKSGDTFWSIAKNHGVDVNRLMKANGVSDARKLRVGMNLSIPR